MTLKQLRLVQRWSHARYFACLSLDGSKLLFVWACGPADMIASGFVVSRSGTRRREYGMLHLPSHFSFSSLTIIIAISLIITVVMNAEDLTRNISCSYLASL